MKKVLMWDITGKCNLRCKHCYNYELIEENNNEMSLKECLKFINSIPAETHVHILGGEPFMKDSFMDILSHLTKRRITYSIVTNGTLLNKDLIHSLMETNITNIVFSIDGADALTHEKIRGKNTFQKVLTNIILFKKMIHEFEQNIIVTVNIAINKFNYKSIDEFYRLLEKIKVDEIVFNRTQQEGNALNNDLVISDKSWIDTCENIAINSKKSNITTLLYGTPLLLSYLNTRYNTNFQLDILACGILKNSVLMYVKSDGTVWPCNKWYKIKNVYDNSINSLVTNMDTDDLKTYLLNNQMYKEIIRLKNDADKYRESLCKNCNFKALCFGCIIDLLENNKLVTRLGECVDVARKIKEYKNVLPDLESYNINDDLIIDFSQNNVIIKNKILHKKITLKGNIKDFFTDMYNNNIDNNSKYKDKYKDYIYELKRLKIIEERMVI